ncbi:hypothetical protein CYLTODRAFT_445321 [Cylindrobasidium torrendii FP15055 ss-10]|uniref:Uncharacterized protein n=1 Tax=Cylindrobasidium torrendii FP15055 ss-10 TaxID=1314674 RepID=A0A0D7B7H2_9AGAR|nr:hypothetical protein CYLTODRAFT_445321 [Cylindrobasidium torrendii FP15055 ss-10]
MSVRTPSRTSYARSRSPFDAETPVRRHGTSPPGSVSSQSPTVMNTLGIQRLNIVNRVAIEGRAKKDRDSVGIKMYLKLSLPVDSVDPGMSIPLFPEDNIKVVTSHVHPLDSNSVPYHFDPKAAPLLHRAARSLCLSSRSNITFNDAFAIDPGASVYRASSSSTTSNGDNGLVDEKYSGSIVVSGYNVSFVVPKYIPEPAEPSSKISFGQSRRMSLSDRPHAHFMAAIEMLVPYVSRPPRSPYLLSIPAPTKCLNNTIKLRIFPPRDSSASTASLSDDDGGTWDLASEPPVTRAQSKLSRRQSVHSFADDESSDSSPTGSTDGSSLNGSFPSTERIRIRWAKPKQISHSDGRRRVGVREVKGDMTCVVKGKMRDPDTSRSGSEGIIMDIDYRATCKGLWYDGVATHLALEVGLTAKSSDVYWVSESRTGWEVTGGDGFMGFDAGVPTPRLKHGESFEGDIGSPTSSGFRSRASSSTSSSASLLRAPLPGTNNIAEYSFEGSVSTIPSVGTSTSNLSQSEGLLEAPPPSQPIMIHVNINEFIPPNHNIFTFSISGTILIVPKPTRSQHTSTPAATEVARFGSVSDPQPVVLPQFSIFVGESSTTATMVRNEVDKGAATVEVYNTVGDYRHDPQARKTVLQKGANTKCGTEGGRIAYRTLPPSQPNGILKSSAPRPRTPGSANTSANISSTSLSKALSFVQPHDGPSIIPYVHAVVTPLKTQGSALPNAYAVRVSLTSTDTESLEFGLGYPDKEGNQPRVDIASVSVDGTPVHFDTVAAANPSSGEVSVVGDGGVMFGQMSGKEWISWVRVHGGGIPSGRVVVDYVVQLPSDVKGKKNTVGFDVFLPTFALPVGRLEVIIEDNSAFDVDTERTNLSFSGARGHLLQFSISAFFYPIVHLTVTNSKRPGTLMTAKYTLPLLLLTSLVLLISIYVSSPSADYSGSVLQLPRIWTQHPHTSSVTPATIQSIPSSSSPPEETMAATLHPAEPTFSLSLETPVETDVIDVEDPEPTLDVPQPPYEVEVYGAYPNPLQRLLDLRWEDFEPLAEATYEKLADAVRSVWQACRRAYHFPIPPA